MLSCQEGTNRDLHKVKLKGETATFSHSRAQRSVSLSSEKWWLLSAEILVLLCVTAISLELPSLWPLKVTGVTRVLSFSWGRKWGIFVKVGNGWGFRRRGMASKIHIFEGGEWLGIYKVGNGFKNSHFLKVGNDWGFRRSLGIIVVFSEHISCQLFRQGTILLLTSYQAHRQHILCDIPNHSPGREYGSTVQKTEGARWSPLGSDDLF